MLNLAQKQAITEMADVLYDLLPGSGASWWAGHVSFATVADKAGVADFWTGASKKPAIVRLLELTLEHRPQVFTRLVAEVVGASLGYRNKKSDPLTRDEVERLNVQMQRLNFRVPELWEETFLASLAQAETARADDASTKEVPNRIGVVEAQLATLRGGFLELAGMIDRQEAGRRLETFLNELFGLFGLEPRPPFRVTGEQIDGSFAFDYETYLVEAKWTQERTEEGPLLEFRGKIEGKSAFTRGVFVSVNGFTGAAIEAITRGKSPTFFLMDGYDLMQVLNSQVELTDLMRHKLRRLAEEGEVLARLLTLN